MGNRRKPEYKQLSFDTAVRNPERYKDFLTVMKEYNGIILNDDNILDIIVNLYEKELIKSKNFSIFNYKSLDEKRKAVKFVNRTRRSDGGFPKGYQSRFWTYMRTPSEFGLVYAQYNEKFILGQVGQLLVDDQIDAQEAFSIQSFKYNRRSPYRNVSNDFNYFKFIINVLKKKRLSYNQFIISLFSEDDDVDSFIKLIEKNRFNDDNKIYNFIKNNYPNVNKKKTVMKDYPDVVLRMLRITGLVNIQYNGIPLIELNTNNLDYINELFKLNYTLSDEEKENAQLYFYKIQELKTEEKIIINKNKHAFDNNTDYNYQLQSIIETYGLTKKKIIKGINDACLGKNGDIRFKYLADPLKLEFYVSLLVYTILGSDYSIMPNYKKDINGFPISHAPGNLGDIEILNHDKYWMLEVTLIRNRTQQLNNETVNLFRHLDKKDERLKYLSLIAPYIHEDTETIFRATAITLMAEGAKNLFAKPYCIENFIDIILKQDIFNDIESYTNELKRTALEALTIQ